MEQRKSAHVKKQRRVMHLGIGRRKPGRKENAGHERRSYRSVAQLVEQRSPKPQVVSSSLSAPAIVYFIQKARSRGSGSGNGMKPVRRTDRKWIFTGNEHLC